MTLWRDDVHLARPLRSAQQRHDARTRLYLRAEHGGVEGWGEIDPQPFALNGDPSVEDVLEELEHTLLAQLRSAHEREGTPPSWTRIARFAGPRAASSWAVTLVEMALLDLELRASEQGIRDRWPKHFATPLQRGVSLLEASSTTLGDDVARVRAKIAPGPVANELVATLAALDRPVLLDYNCAAIDEAQVLAQVRELRAIAKELPLSVIEQPFAPGNVFDHARLARTCDIAIGLDEGVRTQRDLEDVARYGAARVVCIKPARVGGYANARTLFERATQLGLAAYLGGFFESGFARHVHRVLAEHCTAEPSDVGDVPIEGRALGDDVEPRTFGFGLAPSSATLAHATLLWA